MNGNGTVTSIRDTLNRLDRWCDTSIELLEKPLEALLLLDLFRDCLDYDPDHAKSQVQAGTSRRAGVADIVLKTALRHPSQWIVVEIKRPKVIISEEAINQAARYIASKKATRGIVTNGNVWYFINVTSRTGTNTAERVTKLFRLELGKSGTPQRTILGMTLKRCSRATIQGFFKLLEAFSNFGAERIYATARKTSGDNLISTIRGQIQSSTGVHLNNSDVAVLKRCSRDLARFFGCTTKVYGSRRVPRG